jgi:hypothetical protein
VVRSDARQGLNAGHLSLSTKVWGKETTILHGQ